MKSGKISLLKFIKALLNADKNKANTRYKHCQDNPV